MNWNYAGFIRNIIDEIMNTQSNVIEKVSDICAKTIKNGKMLYFFGTGHSHLICEEPFYRAGGLVSIYPILEPSLMLHEGAYKSTLIERMDGLGEILLDESGASKGDALFLISNSGRNNAVIEMALKARDKGIVTIALTSLKHSRGVESRHKSGKKLYEVVDFCIDNCGIPGDACVEYEGFNQKVGPTSTIACTLIVNTIITNIVGKLLDTGITPPVFMSANTDEGDAFNKKLLARYKSRIKIL
ncbi:MAG: SIS domain-containing protein [Clostridiales bacterium]|nr:SIS domain-containing protein [Clostridiales bacterium]